MPQPAFLIAAAGVIACAGCAVTRIADDVPLADRTVAMPDPAVPKVLAAFAGRWAGVWTDGPGYRKNMALIIDEVIAPDRARGTYACGHQYPTPFRYCPGSNPVEGRLEGATLMIPYPAVPAEGRFKVVDGVLEGELVDANTRQVLIRVRAQRLP